MITIYCTEKTVPGVNKPRIAPKIIKKSISVETKKNEPNQILEIQTNVENLKTQMNDINKKVEQTVNILQQQLNSIQFELDAIKTKISEEKGKIEIIKQKISDANKQLNNKIKEMEKHIEEIKNIKTEDNKDLKFEIQKMNEQIDIIKDELQVKINEEEVMPLLSAQQRLLSLIKTIESLTLSIRNEQFSNTLRLLSELSLNNIPDINFDLNIIGVSKDDEDDDIPETTQTNIETPKVSSPTSPPIINKSVQPKTPPPKAQPPKPPAKKAQPIPARIPKRPIHKKPIPNPKPINNKRKV